MQPLKQCVLDKLSPNKDRDPDRNWVGYYGRFLSFEEEPISRGNKPIDDLPLDESQWIKMIEFAQEKNWYSKIEINSGQVILTVIQLTAPEIWDILKPYLSEAVKSGNERLTDLIEKIQGLPVEDILDTLEEIRKILNAPSYKSEVVPGKIILNRDEIRTHQKRPSHKGKRRCEYYY